jgi:hypothetical protein
MKTSFIQKAATALTAALTMTIGLAAHAATASYDITTVWFEPMTQPRDSIFVGTFNYDTTTHAITNLQGKLSESMTHTGANLGYPNDSMVWLNLNYQLASWYDSSLGGTFAAAFKNNSTNTFYNATPGATDFWSPQVGVDNGTVYSGNPVKANNPGNAYALIFVPDNPLAALTSNQLAKLAYADCTPTAVGGMAKGGGMMGAVCMTGTSVAGYGSAGSMDGTPQFQTITAAVPEPSSVALVLVGLGVAGITARRRQA